MELNCSRGGGILGVNLEEKILDFKNEGIEETREENE